MELKATRSLIVPLLHTCAIISILGTIGSGHAKTLEPSDASGVAGQSEISEFPASSTSSVLCKCENLNPIIDETPASSQQQPISSPLTSDIEKNETSKRSDINIPEPELVTDVTNSNQRDDFHSNIEDTNNNETDSTVRKFYAYKSMDLSKGYESVGQDDSSDFLILGTLIGPFQGPRRKRRDVDRTNTKGTSYIYAVNYLSENRTRDSNYTIVSPNNNSLTPAIDAKVSSHKESESTSLNPSSLPKPIVPLQMNANVGPSFPTVIAVVPKGTSWVPPPLGFHPFSTSYNFQRRGDLLVSPWDARISQSPLPLPQPDSTPGPFSSFLGKYIDYEINYHEDADFLRKVFFAIVIGFVVAGWIAFGITIGLFPLNFIFGNTDSEAQRRSNLPVKRGSPREDEFSQRILLSLDSDWLRNLEKTIKRRNGPASSLVNCCVRPENSLVDCEFSTKGRKSSISCPSGLLYNLRFGPELNGVDMNDK